MFTTLEAIADDSEFDVVVLGAGAAGLAAALFAALKVRKVLLVERTEYVGGTTAFSAGTTWIPNTQHASAIGADDSVEKAARYLDEIVGNRAPVALRQAFLRSGPEAVATLEAHTDVKFRPYPLHPDYEQQASAATVRGRALEPLPFDGRLLGANLAYIRPPIPEFTILGGMMVDRADINHLLNLTRSGKSFAHAANILARYGIDRLKGGRGSRLVMGNAMVARFVQSLERRAATILTCTSTTALLSDASGVTGVVLRSGDTSRRIRASQGVVLAAGGYGRSPSRRTELLPAPVPQWSPAAPGHTGELQDLAISLGARFGEGNAENAFWAPVSIRRRPDGSTAVFPHFVLDRSKPGTVCVNQAGRRFVNESTSYHNFGRAMFDCHRSRPCIPCYIITDAVGLRKYGLGMVRMGTRNLAPYLADGYLVAGDTVAELAAKLEVDGTALAATIADMNRFAETGVDPQFGRGTTAYHRVNGDAGHAPNPTLGPIRTKPFYAVRLHVGDIGAATGLVVDEWARVLRADDSPIGRLYACGNDANSIMGGTYPGPGITIGPAITFAYRAIENALQ
jgi:succinate dehydrogenase/fumarate reductase flavoprotein subunit